MVMLSWGDLAVFERLDGGVVDVLVDVLLDVLLNALLMGLGHMLVLDGRGDLLVNSGVVGISADLLAVWMSVTSRVGFEMGGKQTGGC